MLAVKRQVMISDGSSQSGAPANPVEMGTNGAARSPAVDEQSPFSSLRFHQIFPTLTDAEIDRMHRFGALCCYAAGDLLYSAGSTSPGMFVLLSGKVRYTARDGLGRQRLIREDVLRGEFTADIGMLSGKPALVDAEVIDQVEALVIPPDRLRALMIAEAELGEKIMRALILRRVAAIERGQGAVLVGSPDTPRLLALQHFLRRNGFPHMALDVGDADAIALLERLTPQCDDMPLVVCPDGTVLRNPDEGQLASCLGILPEFDPAHIYDVAIVGAGPAGLAAAVYAASEGLSVAAFDCRAPGGQAGLSARIENFLGFPTGISGQALAGRAFNQAQKFGAHIGIPVEVKALHCGEYPLEVELTNSRRVTARTVIIASGAEYRRPAVDRLGRFEGRGIYYWATPIEARLCRNESVLLVGGGNSAGQAVVFLASHAAHVHLLVRGPDLEQSMSRYLIDRIQSLPNVTIHTNCEVAALEGEERLELVRYRRRDGALESIATHHLFLFIGAEPNTSWLRTCGVSVDKKGFVLTGADLGAEDSPRASRLPLQTSVAGVFAIGDVRSRSTKRVAAAVGEGAAVVSQIHQFLAAQSEAAGASIATANVR
ncbi:thioredoxin reductase [Trinickia symbiotica]|uniref:Thioredoxin reductase n=1 Tax=Trinickia symbiotica TaxID=863227 RepID=A0A2T3XZH0_9BURK|nr:FAD-dependent oxidoreductase [Trinickia symbiotica]PTB21881.1 thioredoxin reductase [Trinickia symbiotica]